MPALRRAESEIHEKSIIPPICPIQKGDAVVLSDYPVALFACVEHLFLSLSHWQQIPAYFSRQNGFRR